MYAFQTYPSNPVLHISPVVFFMTVYYTNLITYYVGCSKYFELIRYLRPGKKEEQKQRKIYHNLSLKL